MKFALINPKWSYEGSVYFGCKEAHFPLEFGYTREILKRNGHEAVLIDGQLENIHLEEISVRVAQFKPDFIVITTAPGYLFWRCPPPELRIPMETANALRGAGGEIIIVGPHASTTPEASAKKIGADAAIAGECEDVIPLLSEDLNGNPSVYLPGSEPKRCTPNITSMEHLPAIKWPAGTIALHKHHHHRFDMKQEGLAAEVESSRGCPYHCTFCAKENFRGAYRKRPLNVLLEEIDHLIRHGVQYLYFIDELFIPDERLLQELALRKIKFGIQTRIDLWNRDVLELLGKAGCVSVEAGVESISEAGRGSLGKKIHISDEEITNRLVTAKKFIPFVQANLLHAGFDGSKEIEAWRGKLISQGVWANKPVPVFPYPGSGEYFRRWGNPDEYSWERAHCFYLNEYHEFSDIQEASPLPIEKLESRKGTCLENNFTSTAY